MKDIYLKRNNMCFKRYIYRVKERKGVCEKEREKERKREREREIERKRER